MSARKRKRRERTHEWQEIEQYTLWPEQEVYERIRPLVLFGELASERAKETGTSERTLHYQANLFEQEGMASLFRQGPPPDPQLGRNLPEEICQLIVNLKAEYPGFSFREISTICFLRFGRKPPTTPSNACWLMALSLWSRHGAILPMQKLPIDIRGGEPSSIYTRKGGPSQLSAPIYKRLAHECMKFSNAGLRKDM